MGKAFLHYQALQEGTVMYYPVSKIPAQKLQAFPDKSPVTATLLYTNGFPSPSSSHQYYSFYLDLFLPLTSLKVPVIGFLAKAPSPSPPLSVLFCFRFGFFFFS